MLKIKDGFKGERSLIVPKMVVDFMQRDVLCKLLYITDIGYYPHARHHFRDRRDPIGEHVLIYCAGGRGWYTVDNVRYTVGSDTFFILPAGRPHSYGSDADEPWSIYWMHFSGTLAAEVARGLHTPHEIRQSADSRITERLSLFEEIFATLSASYERDSLHYAHSILLHFIASLRYVAEFRKAAGGTDCADRTDVCEAAIHFMKENIGRHITLRQLADFTGYAPNHFATLFRRSVGHAPLSYFNLLKIRGAAQMLDTTDLKINQVAAKFGFDDSGYFTRLFTKVMGISPTAYRTAARG